MNRDEARAARLAMIEALRAHLGAVPLEIAVVPRIGRQDQGKPIRRGLAPGADPSRVLAWCAAQQINKQAQVWIRPAPDADHPWLFADDVPIDVALRFAAKRAALVIETSPNNCQLRILADRPMTTDERTAAQRVLRQHLGGDPASVAGGKWGRLAGFSNQKPGKTGWWTRLLCIDLVPQRVSADRRLAEALALAPAPAFFPREGGEGVRPHGSVGQSAGPAASPGGSQDDFRFACDEIRAGTDMQAIISAITAAALARGKRRNEAGCTEYAERTVRNAANRVAAEQ
jgi:hypothetical protein